MNVLHKVQLSTLIAIVVSVTILIYIDSAYAQYDAPLKQLKDGVAIQDIQCNEGKLLIHKQDTLSPACVGDIAANDLVFPPYSWATMRIEVPGEEMIQENMCMWYPDVPLVQKNCEKIKSIDSFDFSELETYSNLKDDYFETVVLSHIEDPENNYTVEQISKIYYNCLAQHNNDPVFTVLYPAFNSTHYIDNNLCKWIVHWDGYTSPFGYEKDSRNFQDTTFSSVYPVNGTIDSIFYNESSNVIFDIPYTIQGGTVDAMAHDINANSLLVRIDTSSDGFLTVEIPYQLLTYEEQIACDIFTLVNHEEVAHKISDSRNDNRIVTVNFTDNYPLIEFIGITMPC